MGNALDKKAIYRKTARGLAEITAQKRSVDRRLRPVLILTDGNRTAAHVHALTSGIGIREEDFDQLIADGYIEVIERPEAANDPEGRGDASQPAAPAAAPVQRSEFERYSDGQRYLTETAAEWLGLRSFLFVLKIEKSHTPDELLALVPEFEQAIARKTDREFGRRCARIAETILRK
jgi:hypothetical protein